MPKKIDSEEELEFLVPYLKALLPKFENKPANVPRIRTALREIFLINLDKYKHKVMINFIKKHLNEYGSATQMTTPREEVNTEQRALLKTFRRWDRELEKPPLPEGQVPKKPKRSPTNAMTMTLVGLSEKLQALLGIEQATRTEIVKLIWVYIREHNLQNPDDKREVICDDKMRAVFGDSVTIFTLNKELMHHIIKLPLEAAPISKDIQDGDAYQTSENLDTDLSAKSSSEDNHYNIDKSNGVHTENTGEEAEPNNDQVTKNGQTHTEDEVQSEISESDVSDSGSEVEVDDSDDETSHGEHNVARDTSHTDNDSELSSNSDEVVSSSNDSEYFSLDDASE